MKKSAIGCDAARPPGALAAAIELRDRYGLPILPIGADKAALVAGFTKWRHPPARKTIERWLERYPEAQLAITTGAIAGITVVDIDDAALVGAMVERFGETPIAVATPSGGAHLYYAHDGERCANLRAREGLDVDIKGEGGYVLVPPSTGPSGRPYRFTRGSWADLDSLPGMTGAPQPVVSHLRPVKDGERGDAIFRACLRQAVSCDTLEDLVDVARTINAVYEPPLPDANVV